MMERQSLQLIRGLYLLIIRRKDSDMVSKGRFKTVSVRYDTPGVVFIHKLAVAPAHQTTATSAEMMSVWYCDDVVVLTGLSA